MHFYVDNARSTHVNMYLHTCLYPFQPESIHILIFTKIPLSMSKISLGFSADKLLGQRINCMDILHLSRHTNDD